MVERILVPLDGSDLAETVLPYVERLAACTGASARLLTVAQNEPERVRANSYLQAKQDQLRERTIDASVVVASDGEAETILAEAEAWDADLIAMSTHGRSGALRWVFGSVADKVIHATTRPLLLVRARPAEEHPTSVKIDRILVPLDGSDLSVSVLPYVESIAKALGASLILFNVVIPLNVYPGTEMSSWPTSLIEDMMAQAQSFLATVEKEVEGRGLKARSVVTVGFAVGEIVRVAQDVEAGLIAMATHGRSGVNRWIMGSVADGVVRRSALPCLMVRPEGLAAQE